MTVGGIVTYNTKLDIMEIQAPDFITSGGLSSIKQFFRQKISGLYLKLGITLMVSFACFFLLLSHNARMAKAEK